MHNLHVDNNMFTDKHPTTEGLYLWKTSLGVQLLHVVAIPAKQEYGMDWDSYLAVAEMRNRNVTQLEGKFVRLTIGESYV